MNWKHYRKNQKKLMMISKFQKKIQIKIKNFYKNLNNYH